MSNSRKKISEKLIVFVLISFISVSVLSIGMGMEEGEMSSCPFIAGHAAMCQMNAVEHIAQWQKTFLALRIQENLLALIIVLLAVVVIPFAKPPSRLKELTEYISRLFIYQRMHLVKVFDPLLLAFSDGILKPRIYEPVRV